MLLTTKGKPQTLLIGCIQNQRADFKIGYKTVFKPKTRCLHIEYAGALGDASHSNCIALINSIQNCLKSREADFAYLKFIEHDSPFFSLATKQPSFISRDHFPYLNPHWKLTLPPSYDEFYRQRSKNTKSNIRKYANRIKKRFGDSISVRAFQVEDDIDDAMEDIESIAVNTYQRGLGVGFVRSLEARNEWVFAANRRWLRAYVLYLEEIPCSFLTGYIYRKTFFLETLGFNRQYQYFHPGMFLFMKVLEIFCLDEGVEALDFGLGDAHYKRSYGDHCWIEAGVHIFAPTLKGLHLNAAKTMTTIISRSAKKTLNRFQMVDLIKRKWRQKLTPGKT
jgi:hypothetical protein